MPPSRFQSTNNNNNSPSAATPPPSPIPSPSFSPAFSPTASPLGSPFSSPAQSRSTSRSPSTSPERNRSRPRPGQAQAHRWDSREGLRDNGRGGRATGGRAALNSRFMNNSNSPKQGQGRDQQQQQHRDLQNMPSVQSLSALTEKPSLQSLQSPVSVGSPVGSSSGGGGFSAVKGVGAGDGYFGDRVPRGAGNNGMRGAGTVVNSGVGMGNGTIIQQHPSLQNLRPSKQTNSPPSSRGLREQQSLQSLIQQPQPHHTPSPLSQSAERGLGSASGPSRNSPAARVPAPSSSHHHHHKASSSSASSTQYASYRQQTATPTTGPMAPGMAAPPSTPNYNEPSSSPNPALSSSSNRHSPSSQRSTPQPPQTPTTSTTATAPTTPGGGGGSGSGGQPLPILPLSPTSLSRWTRFALNKGGIGKAVATRDKLAEKEGELMFMRGEEVVVLCEMPKEEDQSVKDGGEDSSTNYNDEEDGGGGDGEDSNNNSRRKGKGKGKGKKEKDYLGYCEGVIGRFTSSDVVFTTKLKKAVFTKSNVPTPKSSSILQQQQQQSQLGQRSQPETPVPVSSSPESTKSPPSTQPTYMNKQPKVTGSPYSSVPSERPSFGSDRPAPPQSSSSLRRNDNNHLAHSRSTSSFDSSVQSHNHGGARSPSVASISSASGLGHTSVMSDTPSIPFSNATHASNPAFISNADLDSLRSPPVSPGQGGIGAITANAAAAAAQGGGDGGRNFQLQPPPRLSSKDDLTKKGEADSFEMMRSGSGSSTSTSTSLSLAPPLAHQQHQGLSGRQEALRDVDGDEDTEISRKARRRAVGSIFPVSPVAGGAGFGLPPERKRDSPEPLPPPGVDMSKTTLDVLTKGREEMPEEERKVVGEEEDEGEDGGVTVSHIKRPSTATSGRSAGSESTSNSMWKGLMGHMLGPASPEDEVQSISDSMSKTPLESPSLETAPEVPPLPMPPYPDAKSETPDPPLQAHRNLFSGPPPSLVTPLQPESNSRFGGHPDFQHFEPERIVTDPTHLSQQYTKANRSPSSKSASLSKASTPSTGGRAPNSRALSRESAWSSMKSIAGDDDTEDIIFDSYRYSRASNGTLASGRKSNTSLFFPPSPVPGNTVMPPTESTNSPVRQDRNGSASPSLTFSVYDNYFPSPSSPAASQFKSGQEVSSPTKSSAGTESLAGRSRRRTTSPSLTFSAYENEEADETIREPIWARVADGGSPGGLEMVDEPDSTPQDAPQPTSPGGPLTGGMSLDLPSADLLPAHAMASGLRNRIHKMNEDRLDVPPPSPIAAQRAAHSLDLERQHTPVSATSSAFTQQSLEAHSTSTSLPDSSTGATSLHSHDGFSPGVSPSPRLATHDASTVSLSTSASTESSSPAHRTAFPEKEMSKRNSKAASKFHQARPQSKLQESPAKGPPKRAATAIGFNSEADNPPPSPFFDPSMKRNRSLEGSAQDRATVTTRPTLNVNVPKQQIGPVSPRAKTPIDRSVLKAAISSPLQDTFRHESSGRPAGNAAGESPVEGWTMIPNASGVPSARPYSPTSGAPSMSRSSSGNTNKNLRSKASNALMNAGLASAAVQMASKQGFNSAHDVAGVREGSANGWASPPPVMPSPSDSDAFDLDDHSYAQARSSSVGRRPSRSLSRNSSGGRQRNNWSPEPLPVSQPLIQAISSKDFEDKTVNLGGDEFEMITPGAVMMASLPSAFDLQQQNSDDDEPSAGHLGLRLDTNVPPMPSTSTSTSPPTSTRSPHGKGRRKRAMTDADSVMDTDDEDDSAPLATRPSAAARARATILFMKDQEEDGGGGDDGEDDEEDPEVDEHGFFVKKGESSNTPAASEVPDATAQQPGQGPEQNLETYRSKELKWVAVMSSMTPAGVKKSKKMKLLVRAGIPSSVRGRVWGWLAETEKYRVKGFYHELCARDRLPVYDEIEKDLGRCYPDHSHFRPDSDGREDLGSVLKAFAHYDSTIGYCQGLDMIAGMLLLQAPAEDAFWMLVAVTDMMKGYHTVGMEGFHVDAIVLGKLLEAQDPRLAKKLTEHDVVPTMFYSNWILPLFTRTLPWASLLRVLDVFFFSGPRFLFRVSLALFDLIRDDLLSPSLSSQLNQSDLLDRLIHIPKEKLQPEMLLPTAHTIRINKKMLKRLTKKAEVFVREGGRAGMEGSSGKMGKKSAAGAKRMATV